MLLCSANSWFSFWRWPSLTSNPFGILLRVILRQSQNSTIIFFFLKEALYLGTRFLGYQNHKHVCQFKHFLPALLRWYTLNRVESTSSQRENWSMWQRLLEFCRVGSSLESTVLGKTETRASWHWQKRLHNGTTIIKAWMGWWLSFLPPPQVTELLIPTASRNGVWPMTRVPICYFHKLFRDLRQLQQSWWLNSKVGTVAWLLFCSALNPGFRGKRGKQTNGQRAIASLITGEQFSGHWKAEIETTTYL